MLVRNHTQAAIGARTRLALLGTIGPLHAEPLRYDLPRLRRVLEEVEPDLLGVEIDPVAWELGELGEAPLEVREGLVPAARRLDTVVVPLGRPSHPCGHPGEGGMRATLVRALDAVLVAMQRRLDEPHGVDAPLFKHICGLICELEASAANETDRRAWQASNVDILDRVLWIVRRDPGCRVLVAVQCRRVHWLESQLRVRDEVQLTRFTEL